MRSPVPFQHERSILTPLDVAIYLAAHEDEDEIGLCLTPLQCLLARVMQAKYPDLSQVEVYETHMYFSSGGEFIEIPLSQELKAIHYVQDYQTGHQWREPVRKREFLTAWQARGKQG